MRSNPTSNCIEIITRLVYIGVVRISGNVTRGNDNMFLSDSNCVCDIPYVGHILM